MYISRCGTTFYEESFENYKFLDELGIDSGYIYAENPPIETVDNVKVCIYTYNMFYFTLQECYGIIKTRFIWLRYHLTLPPYCRTVYSYLANERI